MVEWTRQALLAGGLALVGCLAGCGDDSEEPERSGPANQYADAVSDLDHGFQVSARDDEADASVDANYNIRYNPAKDESGDGWAAAKAFADDISCRELPAERPDEEINVRCE